MLSISFRSQNISQHISLLMPLSLSSASQIQSSLHLLNVCVTCHWTLHYCEYMITSFFTTSLYTHHCVQFIRASFHYCILHCVLLYIMPEYIPKYHCTFTHTLSYIPCTSSSSSNLHHRRASYAGMFIVIGWIFIPYHTSLLQSVHQHPKYIIKVYRSQHCTVLLLTVHHPSSCHLSSYNVYQQHTVYICICSIYNDLTLYTVLVNALCMLYKKKLTLDCVCASGDFKLFKHCTYLITVHVICTRPQTDFKLYIPCCG